MTQIPKQSAVVTCILESEGKILILKRSVKVGTYQGKWGGVAGFIETDPNTQALTEIREETGLETTDIEPVRKAPSIVVEDKINGWKWTVHPFLFHVKNASKIMIDWEHTEMKWINPADIGRYETVPGLGEVITELLDTSRA